MKIILTQSVDGLGVPGDVVTVKDGYGRNYLVPRGMAMPWTAGGEKQVTQIKRARDAREIRDVAHAKEVKEQLEGLTVVIPARAGESGTWLHPEIIALFELFHRAGLAHSVEAWIEEPGGVHTLVGGVYGVAIGSVFCAESMYCRPDLGGSDAGKIALVTLVV